VQLMITMKEVQLMITMKEVLMMQLPAMTSCRRLSTSCETTC
jgi:hypothetical protein